MLIKFDDNGAVLGFAEIGGMDGAIEWSGDVPDGFKENCKTYKLAEGALVKDEARADELERQKSAREELIDIYEWFSWYDNQTAQYQRAVRLGESFDRNIEELDAMAKAKQLRIRVLKGE